MLVRASLLALAVLQAAVAPVFAGAPQRARPNSSLILPAAVPGLLLSAPSAPKTPLIVLLGGVPASAPSGLLFPDGQLATPQSAIVPASRPLTAEELAAAGSLSPAELARLAGSLAEPPEEEGESQTGADALREAFDGAKVPDAQPALDYFGESGPLAPALAKVDAAERSLWSLLMPAFDKKFQPATLGYAKDGETAHRWTEDGGHAIRIAPRQADARGEVGSEFGEARVQQKIERLMLLAHERSHVLFDTLLRKPAAHGADSAYSAMTEGFAVVLEKLFDERLLAAAPGLRLTARDAGDLAVLGLARERWLETVDSKYSEGIVPWRAAYESGGEAGLLAFAASLSAQRLARVSRAEPAYQLSAGSPELLTALLGRDAQARAGHDAFAKAARGEILDAAEQAAAAELVEKAGPEGRRRLFERSLLADRRFKQPVLRDAAKWWKQEEPEPLVEPAFAVARLSLAGAAELARFLAAAITADPDNLLERRTGMVKLQSLAAGAESLPWDAQNRAAWLAALTAWLTR